MANNTKTIFTFHDNTTTISNGNELSISDGFDTALISITSTDVATIIFEGTVDGTNWESIGYTMRISTVDVNTTATFTTAGTQIWKLDLTGFRKVRTRVSAISGTVSIIGRIVS